MTMSPDGRSKFKIKKNPSDFALGTSRRKYDFRSYLDDVQHSRIKLPGIALVNIGWIATIITTIWSMVGYGSLYPLLMPVAYLVMGSIYLYYNYKEQGN